jgi:hypothetical protein
MHQFSYMLNSVMLAVLTSKEQFGSVEVYKSEHPQAHLTLLSLLRWNSESCDRVLYNRTDSFVSDKERLTLTPNLHSCISLISIQFLDGNTNYMIRIRSHEKYHFIHNNQGTVSIGLDNRVL